MAPAARKADCSKMGVKWPKKGAKWRLLREHATLLVMAQPLYCHVVALIVVQKSAERQIATIIYKSRTCVEKLVSQNLENLAFRSISRMQSGANSGSLLEGRSKHWPCRKATQRLSGKLFVGWAHARRVGRSTHQFPGKSGGFHPPYNCQTGLPG